MENLLIKVLIIVIFAFIFIYSVYKLIKLIKKGYHNIRNFDDSLFDVVDKFDITWGETNENYISHLNVINFLYSKNGVIQEKIVKAGRIDRLYARLDFLEKKYHLYDDLRL